MKKLLKQTKGFTLLELSLAIMIFAIVAAGVALPIIGNHLGALENEKNLAANTVLTESWEAVRAIRNNDWNNVTNGTHGLRNLGGYWEFSGGSDSLQSGFTRTIIVSDIQRDASGDLVDSGGTVDLDSKKVVIQISWQPSEGQNRSIDAESIVTNYKNPGVWPPA